MSNENEKASKETIEAVKKAKEVLEEISEDAHERYLAELRQKYIMDQHAIEDYGYDRGVEDKTIEIAKKMLERKADIKFISECTGLSEDEIKKL